MTSVSVSDVRNLAQGIDLRVRIRLFEVVRSCPRGNISVADDATTAPQQNESDSAAKQHGFADSAQQRSSGD
jgi:hypothetical protein